MLEERPVAIDITAQLAEQLQSRGIANADDVAREISARLSPIYGEEDLRDAFRSGWHERNRHHDMKRQARKNVHNAIMHSLGGWQPPETESVPYQRPSHNSVWTNSGFPQALCKETHSAETL